jgi:hypothetical protein
MLQTLLTVGPIPGFKAVEISYRELKIFSGANSVLGGCIVERGWRLPNLRPRVKDALRGQRHGGILDLVAVVFIR